MRGVRAWGPITIPITHALASWLCALWGRQPGARARGLLLGCGVSAIGRSPSPHRPSLGLAGGDCYWLAVGADGIGVGTRHEPHSPRSCKLALHAVGAARGRPGGGASCLGLGCPGLGALPRPKARPWGVRLGPATHWLWVREVWTWGPVSNLTGRALASWLCALWWRHKGARGGPLLPGCGASRVGRSHMPDRPCLGHAAEAHYPLAVGAEGVGVGTRHQPHSARSCELALRNVGPAQGPRGGGGALAWVRGARRWALSHAQPPVCGACGQGPLPTSSGCAGCGRGDPSPTPQCALLRAGFDRCGGGTRAPGGAGSHFAVGRPRLGALPRPSAPP